MSDKTTRRNRSKSSSSSRSRSRSRERSKTDRSDKDRRRERSSDRSRDSGKSSRDSGSGSSRSSGSRHETSRRSSRSPRRRSRSAERSRRDRKSRSRSRSRDRERRRDSRRSRSRSRSGERRDRRDRSQEREREDSKPEEKKMAPPKPKPKKTLAWLKDQTAKTESKLAEVTGKKDDPMHDKNIAPTSLLASPHTQNQIRMPQLRTVSAEQMQKTYTQTPMTEERAKMIEVVLNDRLGKKVRVKCNSDDTVGDLKKLAAAQLGTRSDKIRIQKWYNVYKDGVRLDDYEIHDGMGLELYYM